MTSRFFLSRDSSCHWYIVPCEHRAEWNDWFYLDEDDPASWNQPVWAVRLNGSPERLEFSDPIEIE